MKPAQVDVKELQKAFGDDLDLFLFFVTWIKNGLVAKHAYKELHPHVTDGSAEVLGVRELGKVKRELIMAAYGLGAERYFQQLKDGLDATKWNDFTGEREPDHKTRREYHKTLGTLLGIEKDAQPQQQANQILNIDTYIAQVEKDRGI